MEEKKMKGEQGEENSRSKEIFYSNQYKSIIDGLTVGIVIVGFDFKIIMFNEQMRLKRNR